jgi:hypothetical protein
VGERPTFFAISDNIFRAELLAIMESKKQNQDIQNVEEPCAIMPTLSSP